MAYSAKCYFCGKKSFKNKQAVRAHLRWCFAYQNRDDIVWKDTIDMRLQIEKIQHKLDMIKLYDERGARLQLATLLPEKNPEPQKTKRISIGVICPTCNAVVQCDPDPGTSMDCYVCGTKVSVNIPGRKIRAKTLEEKKADAMKEKIYYCKKCGYETNFQWGFCSRCGVREELKEKDSTV